MAEGGIDQNDNPFDSSESSEAFFDFICQPCDSDGHTFEAVGYCVDCSEFLCNECYKCHLRPTPMRHHTLVSTEEARSTKVIKDICTEKCPDHHGKVVEYYCADHDYLGCTVCMTLDHSKCEGKKYIPNISEEATGSEEYTGVINTLQTVIIQAKSLNDASNLQVKKSEEEGDKALNDFEKIKKEAINILDKLERDLKSDIDQRKLNNKQAMEEIRIKVDGVQKRADKMKISLEQMKEKGKCCQVFVDMKKNKNGIFSFTKQLNKISENNVVSEYLFRPSTQLEEFLKHKGKHGKITETEGMKINAKAVHLSDINGKIKGDLNKCSIRGMVILKSNKLLISDNRNHKVKMIDIGSCTVITEHKTTSAPWDIAVTETEDTLAVTLSDECKLIMFKNDVEALVKEGEIITSSKCYSIASTGDIFIVGLVSPERIEILDRRGQVLSKMIKNEKGDGIFSDIRGISFNKTNATIYVADKSTKSLIRLSLSGNVLNTFQGDCLEDAGYSGVNKKGNVFVGSVKTNKVFLFSPDCPLIGEVDFEKECLHAYRSLVFCDKTNKMFVGQYDDNIKVYQLETAIQSK